MTEPASWTHVRVQRRVHAAMTAAMRADVHAIDAALVQHGSGSLDAHSREFLGASRRLVLACTAALTCVLSTHRPGTDARGRDICHGCGTPGCRTLQGIADVLTAYAVRPGPIDRAEAWRRADNHFAHGARPVPVIVEEFPDGFIARAATAADGPRPILIVDRLTGALSRWPSLPHDTLVREYARHHAGR
ncbi:hypothetical protein HUT06_27495 [Actinomadura sp. NAK00032]|uniref:hypothetical protein n=1 Tax=Actinomadura sp. NAK00032 TaxID=2742128 RepID=UPI00159041AF|nr:hypothetical protein [Actinomadura sp. NAK00032]QKW37293.1 hypothetical protein HUT06_27495 [Actinomadura sp. NAK00032]